MNAHDEVALWHALYQLETRYWHEVDANGGRNAHEFYLPDGLMVVGHNRFQGRDKIKDFFSDFDQYPYQAGNSLNAGGINYAMLRQQDALKRLKDLEGIRPR